MVTETWGLLYISFCIIHCLPIDKANSQAEAYIASLSPFCRQTAHTSVRQRWLLHVTTYVHTTQIWFISVKDQPYTEDWITVSCKTHHTAAIPVAT